MSETRALIKTLKQALRRHPLTYAEVACGLGMSEANVKRLFASERIALDRIEAICRLIDMDLSDLFQLFQAQRQQIQQLSDDQEKELVADSQLMLVAVSVRNQLNFAEILQYHHISESNLIRALAKLDRLKIIDLLPNNKIKLRIDQNFSWIKGGPIERFYQTAIQNEFLHSHFDSNGRRFVFGMLGENSQAIIHNRLQALAREFVELHQADRQLPWNKRKSVGMLMATREWDFSILSPYVKKKGEK
tara:strand:- start:247 stop:987 length:741 start_codon:yes stop_codon:yes gene_type:complete